MTDQEAMLRRIDALLEGARGIVVALEEIRDEVAGTASTEPMRICRELADGIASYGARPKISAAWLTEARRMLEVDGLDLVEVLAVIEWLTTGTGREATFWRRNVLSVGKLRQQFTRLKLARAEDDSKTTNGRAQRIAASIKGGQRR